MLRQAQISAVTLVKIRLNVVIPRLHRGMGRKQLFRCEARHSGSRLLMRKLKEISPKTSALSYCFLSFGSL